MTTVQDFPLLGSVSSNHLRRVIRQTLQLCMLEETVWGTVVLSILRDIGKTFSEQEHEFSTIWSAKVHALLDGRASDWSATNGYHHGSGSQETVRQFCFMAKGELEGSAKDSIFAANEFRGIPLSASPIWSDDRNSTGGTIVLHASASDFERLVYVFSFLLYVYCSLICEDAFVRTSGLRFSYIASEIVYFNSPQIKVKRSKRHRFSLSKRNTLDLPVSDSMPHQVVAPAQDSPNRKLKLDQRGFFQKVQVKLRKFVNKRRNNLAENDGAFNSVIERSRLCSAPSALNPSTALIQRNPDTATTHSVLSLPRLEDATEEEDVSSVMDTDIGKMISGRWLSHTSARVLAPQENYWNLSQWLQATMERSQGDSGQNPVESPIRLRIGEGVLQFIASRQRIAFAHTSHIDTISTDDPNWQGDISKTAEIIFYNTADAETSPTSKQHSHTFVNDLSICQVILQLCDQVRQAKSRTNEMDDHAIPAFVFNIMQHNRVITFHASMNNVSNRQRIVHEDNIDVHSACRRCKKESRTQTLPPYALQFSFGKWLELFLQASGFSCGGCTCKKPSDYVMTEVIFQVKNFKVVMRMMDKPIKRIKGPPASSEITDADPVDLEDGAKTSSMKDVIKDVTSFKDGIQDHIKIMQIYYEAQSKRTQRSQNGNSDWLNVEALLAPVEALLTSLEAQNSDISQHHVNNARIAFRAMARDLLQSLNEWQNSVIPQFSAGLEIPLPNYVTHEDQLLFPDSSVIIRKKEPSSIVAFTLASLHYQRELRHENNSRPNSISEGYTPSNVIEHQGSESESQHDSGSYASDSIRGNSRRGSIDTKINIGSTEYTFSVKRKPLLSEKALVRKVQSAYAAYQDNRNGAVAASLSSSPSSEFGIDFVSAADGDSSGAFDIHEGSIQTGDSINKDLVVGEKFQLSPSPSLQEILGTGTQGSPRAQNGEIKESNRRVREKTSDSGVSLGMSRQPVTFEKANPHIRLRFEDDKLQFDCTVYFAKEFERLRERLDVHDAYINSLGRCNKWDAIGGKSKSQFFKTRNGALIIKQMVSAWHVAERDALLQFAPRYFTYMDTYRARHTALVKMLGFYTVKIKDRTTKKVIMEMDILIMEQLFAGKQVSAQYDLKGIPDRKCPNDSATVLWDRDWLLQQHTHKIDITQPSYQVVWQAILNDTRFLASSNIMDYSLLLGVDEDGEEVVVGLIDYIGSFTWYKSMESRGKATLKGSKDRVTILPPNEYRKRFISSLKNYFSVVPDTVNNLPFPSASELPPLIPNILNPTIYPDNDSPLFST